LFGVCFLLDGINPTAMGSFFPNQPDRAISSRLFPRCPMRLLFASIHSYLDPSSGAALATREMLELLAGRGMDCRVLSAGVLDHERETSLDEVLAALELPARRFQAELGGGGSAGVIVPVFAGPDRTRDHAREGVGSNGRSPNLGREADDRSVRRGSPDPAVSADRTSPWSGARS
jgi:hypothetical protein